MACPLHAILNPSDLSPRKRKFETEDAPNKRQRLDTDPTTPTPVFRTANYETLPIVDLSPVRGALYNRRAGRSPTQHHVLPTPPRSDHHEYWFDMPPPHEIDFGKFNVFKALLNHPELMHHVSKHLDIIVCDFEGLSWSHECSLYCHDIGSIDWKSLGIFSNLSIQMLQESLHPRSCGTRKC